MNKVYLIVSVLLSAFIFCSFTTKEVTESQEKEVKKEIPILAWFSIPDGKYATLERYQELRDAGFTINFSHCRSLEDMKISLDLAEKVGMKSIAFWGDQSKDTENAVNQLKDHPALWGYHLRDEPRNEQLEDLGKLYERIHSLDPKHPCYMNLFPLPAAQPYAEHVDLYFKYLNLPQLSFDFYPIREDENEEGKIIYHPQYYENLEVIRDKSKEYGVPFWAFALAVPHASYPMPTIGHLRFQMYSNLCYGAQCLQYFTYWSPGPYKERLEWKTPFHDAPITHDGMRTQVYELVRDFNKELQNWADVFVGCNVLSVYHGGANIPKGTKRLEKLPEHFLTLDTSAKPALISTLENEGKRYVVVMNTSHEKSLRIDIRTDDKVMLVRNDGTKAAANKYSFLTLTAGNICVFQIMED